MKKLLIPSLIASVTLAGGIGATSASAAIKVENVKAGQFCKKTDAGKVKRATNGARVKCVKVKGRYRWRNA